ncbi:MAG TPA: hypothetical protein VIZ17_02210, partial [Acetobacteraceae bacterium]
EKRCCPEDTATIYRKRKGWSRRRDAVNPRHPLKETRPMHDNLPAQKFNRRTMGRLLAAGSLIPLALARRADAQQSVGAPSGTVTMEQTEVSLLANAGWGRGTLDFQGHAYRFRLHNLGVGGIGYSKMSARGNVFGLSRPEDFSGLYGLLAAGAVAANDQLRGGVWLQNTSGVRMHLVPTRQGLALNFGADGLVIQFEK